MFEKAKEINIVRVNSIYELFSDPKYSPLAWLGDYFTAMNEAYDEGYTRPGKDAPDDIFKATFGKFYQFFYEQYIWTYEPLQTHMIQVKTFMMWMVSKFPFNPM